MTLGELLRTNSDSVVDWFLPHFRLYERFTTPDAAISAVLLVLAAIVNAWVGREAREDRHLTAYWKKQQREREGEK